ncbi:MAG: SprT-like domain-containing protein, partial [Verrucomicrobiota bacterium]
MRPEPNHLAAELELATLRALGEAWGQLNYRCFQRRMQRPVFALLDATTFLARWVPHTRSIEFARTTLTAHPWGVVEEILKHEMAHQYVSEVLGRTDETSHGPSFRAVCESLGMDPRAAGVPAASPERAAEEGAILDRIRKLLALAESPNEHEAQLAMSAAQRLMLKYNLDAVSRRASSGYTYRHLGTPARRIDESQRYLATILREHFFVEVIWVSVWQVGQASWGTVIEVCGTPGNLDLAEYVHSFLHHTAEALWKQHRRTQGITGDRDRRAFRAGVMAGFREKLAAERRRNAQTGLVWVGDPALRTYYDQRHPRRRKVHASSSAGDAAGRSRSAGRDRRPRRGRSGRCAGVRRPAFP